MRWRGLRQITHTGVYSVSRQTRLMRRSSVLQCSQRARFVLFFSGNAENPIADRLWLPAPAQQRRGRSIEKGEEEERTRRASCVQRESFSSCYTSLWKLRMQREPDSCCLSLLQWQRLERKWKEELGWWKDERRAHRSIFPPGSRPSYPRSPIRGGSTEGKAAHLRWKGKTIRDGGGKK